ncbi:Enzyme that catalyzes the fourth step in the histidine pathway, partial [Gonapodya sp. JEL0774]
LIRAVDPKPTARVIELATGPGHIALAFAQHVQEVVAVDITDGFLEIAKRNKLARGINNVAFATGDVESPTGLSFPGASFDAAVCRLAFHHFQNPNKVLAEMARLVKPTTGVVAVEDVYSSGINVGRAQFQDEWETLRDPSHTRFLPLAELIAAFGQCGLEIEKVDTSIVEQNVERWFQTTRTPPDSRAKVVEMLERDMKACIDLHDGKVKQIVGGTLSDSDPTAVKENFVASHPPSYYASLYKRHALPSPHCILLGATPANTAAAKDALAGFPGGIQVGGGVTDENASKWLEDGAEKVIVTSWLFPGAKFDIARLRRLEAVVGKGKLVVDVSCRRVKVQGDSGKQEKWVVAMNKWQTLTDMEVNLESIRNLSNHCSELLIHAADVEGLQLGVDLELIQKLSEWLQALDYERAKDDSAERLVVTYAGGARSREDLELVERASGGRIDLTIGR